MPNEVTPTQADREAAEEWTGLIAASLGYKGDIVADLAQDFAAHRIAHEAPLLAENERLRKRLEVVPGWSEDADGIACRNDTIALQDARIEKLRARVAELENCIRVADTLCEATDRLVTACEARAALNQEETK